MDESGRPVILIAIANTDKTFGKNFPWVNATNIKVKYGSPIWIKDIEQEKIKGLGMYFQELIQKMLDEIRLSRKVKY